MKKYYIIVDETQAGPYSIEELKEKVITKESLIWAEGMENWVKAESLEAFREIVKNSPPPIPKQIMKEPYLSSKPLHNNNVKPIVANELKSVFHLLKIGFFICVLSFPLYYFVIFNANKYDNGRLYIKSDTIYGVDNKDIEAKFIYWQDIKGLGCEWVIQNRKRLILETSIHKSLMVYAISFGILLAFRYISKGTKWIDKNSK